MTGAGGRFLALALAAAALGSAPAPPQDRSAAVFGDPPRKVVLKTGLPLIFHRDTASPATALGIVIPGGRSAVPEGLDGLAYLTARLSLEIPDEDKVRDLMAQATRLSVWCSEDFAFLLVECLSEDLEAALRVAAKIVQDPLLSAIRVGAVKEAMAIQARAETDEPVLSARGAAFAGFFRGKGYGSAAYGTDASRKAIGRKDVVAFYRRTFTDAGVFFCVASDLDLAEIQALLERHFSRVPRGEAGEALPQDPPALPAERKIVLPRETGQTLVARAFALPAPTAEGHALGTLLEAVLGRGPGSRLWDLRSVEKLAYEVEARLTWTKGAGLLEAFLVTESGRTERAAAALDRTLARLREEGLTAEELGAAKTVAKAAVLRAVEPKVGRIGLLALYEVLGLGPGGLAGIAEALEAVGAEAFNAYVKAVLDPERALEVTVGPGAAGGRQGDGT